MTLVKKLVKSIYTRGDKLERVGATGSEKELAG